MKTGTTDSISTRIAGLRKSRNMTQEKLAEMLNVSPKHISHVERGCANLSIENLIEVSKIFNCSLDYIIIGRVSEQDVIQLPEGIVQLLHSENKEMLILLNRYLEVFLDIYDMARE